MKTHQGYVIKPSKNNPASYVIVTEGGKGSVPSTLDGMYTSTSIAVRAIDFYLDTKEKPSGNKSNKTVEQSGV